MLLPRLISALPKTAQRASRALAIMPTRGDSTEKLRQLRELMRNKGVDAYIVPSEDAHASEYLADRHKRRAWLTSFTGSAGCAVVTQDEAYCWTDGRYWLQASEELDDNWTLMKAGLPEVPTWGAWLKQDFAPASKIGIDPHMIPYVDAQGLNKSLATVGSELVAVKENLIDRIWSDPPQIQAEPAFVLDEKYAGESLMNKLRSLREELAVTGSPGIVVSMLDEVAWMFNLRGSDIAYNPVFFSYAILTKRDCTLFINPSALTPNVREHLKSGGVAAVDYEKCIKALESWGNNLRISPPASPVPDKDAKEGEPSKPKVVTTDKVLIGNKTSWAVAMAVGEEHVEVRRSPVETAKAKKNAASVEKPAASRVLTIQTEIEGFRQCHIRDGAALTRYFAWLEEQLHAGVQLSEFAAADQLEAYRKENELFMGLSFDTISSTGPNGAIIHYSPDPKNSAIIDPSKMYLCDSGAQYLDGTTDTTRTLHFGTPTDEERRAFTRVLQGHIAIDSAVFPAGTTGYLLDILARRPLWQDGLDYRHGTSHGVGSFLNVHEGPQGVGTRIAYNDVALVEGMVMSNEPGYYADGKFGIRIENIVVVRRADTPNNFGGKGYLELERVTMCPIQTSLVQLDLLMPTERAWLNAYHAEVLEKTAPVLERFGDVRALAWLEKACQAV